MTLSDIDYVSSLRLPDLSNKTVLYIGERFDVFFRFAVFSSAKSIINFFERVGKAFHLDDLLGLSQEDFAVESLSSFDVVVLDNYVDQIKDFDQCIAKIFEFLNPNSILIVDTFIYSNPSRKSKDKIKSEVKKRSNTLLTATRLKKILKPYAYKIYPNEYYSDTAHCKRKIIHISPRKKYAILMLSDSASGKSTFGQFLLNQGQIELLSGDSLYRKISTNKTACSDELYQCISKDFSSYKINRITERVFDNNLYQEFFSILVSECKNNDIIVDTYVPNKYRTDVVKWFKKNDYFPVLVSLENSSYDQLAAFSKIKSFSRYLSSLDNTSLRFNVQNLTVTLDNLTWCLDSPKNKSTVENLPCYPLSGWLYIKDSEVEPFVRIRSFGNVFDLPLNKKRPDVLAYLKKHTAISEAEQKDDCLGFSYDIASYYFEELCVSVVVGEKEIDVAKITCRHKLTHFLR